MATWRLVFYAGLGQTATEQAGRSGLAQIPGRPISSQLITVGTTPVVVPAGTQLIQVVPDALDGDGFYWFGEGAVTVTAGTAIPVYDAHPPQFLEWRNNWSFVHSVTAA
jgi:hypothetical protein